MKKAFVVAYDRDRKTYGVYSQPGADGTGQSLLEGGFFSRFNAEDARDIWERTHLKEEVERLHRYLSRIEEHVMEPDHYLHEAAIAHLQAVWRLVKEAKR